MRRALGVTSGPTLYTELVTLSSPQSVVAVEFSVLYVLDRVSDRNFILSSMEIIRQGV